MDNRAGDGHTPPRRFLKMHTFFIVILVLASIVALTFIVERGLALRWGRVIPPAIQNAVSFYKSQLSACRGAVDTWSHVGIRFGVVKDIRVFIGKMIWETRDLALFDVGTHNGHSQPTSSSLSAQK